MNGIKISHIESTKESRKMKCKPCHAFAAVPNKTSLKGNLVGALSA
jgi:hypothetical protein